MTSYQVCYNKVKDLWMVYKVTRDGGELVKTYKTEAAARKYVANR